MYYVLFEMYFDNNYSKQKQCEKVQRLKVALQVARRVASFNKLFDKDPNQAEL